MTGTTSTGPSGSSFSYSESSSYTESATDYGDVTDSGVITPFSEYTASSATYRYSVTGPPLVTAYQESVASSTLTGDTPLPASFTQTDFAGHGDTAATFVAEYAGSAPAYSAEHLGTTPGELETTDGLAAAMGGMAVHPLLFAGPEVVANVNSAGNAINLEEAYSSTSPTNWVSHPSGIGYRRSVPASGSGSSRSPGIPGNAPLTDSGTTDGSNDQELARLVNFDTGGNENPTSTQTAPTSRAEEQAGVATTSGIDPPDGGGIMGPTNGDEPPWRAGVNPYTGHGNYNPFAGWFGFGGGEGIPDATDSATDPTGVAYASWYGNDSDTPLHWGSPGGPGNCPVGPENGPGVPYRSKFDNPNYKSPGETGFTGETGPTDSGPPPGDPAPGSQTPGPQTGPDSSTSPDSPSSPANDPFVGMGDGNGGDWGDPPSDAWAGGDPLDPNWEAAMALLGGLDQSFLGGAVADGVQVWSNTAGQGMGLGQRAYVAGGTGLGTLVGVRQVSDAGAQHDAVDAHAQSTGERVSKGVLGSVQVLLAALGLGGLGKSVAGGALNAAKGLTQGETSAINKIGNILNKNFKQGPKGDISGAVADMVGSPIPKPGRGAYDHVQDLGNILRGLRNNADALSGSAEPSAIAARQQALQAIEQIENAIKGAGL